MLYYSILFIIPYLVSLIVVPLLRQTAISSNILDQPNDRKIHKNALPRIGGIAIAIAFFFSLGVGYVFLPIGQTYIESIVGLCIGASIIALVGIWDDIRGLNASKKLLGQIAAVLATLPFGFIIRELNIPFVGIIEVNSIVGFFLVIFWAVGIMNAINLIDGIDGLAGGVIGKIAAALFVISLFTGQTQMALMCIILLGAVFGFLRYNFPSATIFMGDCGALFLGYITSMIALKVLFQNPNIASSSVIPVLIFGLPILDTIWAIIRRLLKHRAPFTADLGHLHYRLLNLVKTQQKATLILYLVNLLSVGSGLAIFFLGSDIATLLICIIMIIIGTSIVLTLNYLSPQKNSINEQDLRLNTKNENVIS
jgi:UDP-GlcNAc:undecaprenyl-phosphate/decaprenyl-phosphate GlcNAc-1-phosphate transferase